MKVVQLFYSYLNTTENWCYRLIKNLPDTELIVVAEELTNETVFPLPHARFCIAPYPVPKSASSLLIRKVLTAFVLIMRMLWHRLLAYQVKGADLMHAHFSFVGWDYLWLSQKTKIPLVISYYGVDYESLPYIEPVWKERYQKLFLTAALFIAEGSVGRSKLIDIGCPVDKVKVVHLGVETANIPYYKRNKKQNELRLVQIATFTSKKGHDTTIQAFIKAFPKCPGMTLTLVGKDPEGIRASLQKVISEHGLDKHVEFIDGIDFSKLHTFLKQFHAFIHPSKYGKNRDSEGGAPIVLLDAQATGMPVLSTRHCDIPDEVIDGVTGILVEESDSDGLANAIETFYKMDEPAYHAYCENARKHIEENYDAVTCAWELKNAYDSLLKRNVEAATE